MKKFLVLILLLFWGGSGYSQSTWTATTPFRWTNDQTSACIVAHPASNHLFIGKEEGGILKSTNAGESWVQVATFPVYSLSVRSDGTIFAGGEGVIYRSTDQGQTWTTHAIGSTYPVTKIIFNSSGHLFAGTGRFVKYDSNDYTGDGILKSADNGQTWTTFNSGLSGTRAVQSLAIDAQDRLYVGISDTNGGSGGGLYTLAADGVTWQQIPVSINNSSPINIAYAEALVADTDGTIYFTLAGAIGNMAALGTVKTTNGGASWSLVATETPAPGSTEFLRFNGLFLSQDGSLYGTLTGGGSTSRGVYRSTNKGASWTFQQPHPNLYEATQFTQASNGNMYVIKQASNIVYKMSGIPTAIKAPLKETLLALQAYPNPFREQLSINYSLKTPATVRLTISDALGKSVFFHTEAAKAGTNTLTWDPRRAAPGVYFAKIQQGQMQTIQKVVLAR